MRLETTARESGKIDPWTVVCRLAGGLITAIVVMGVIALFTPTCRQLHKLQGEKVVMEQENRALAEEINELRMRQERFQSDPEFVERTAKDLGMIKSNEVVIKNEPLIREQPKKKEKSRK